MLRVDFYILSQDTEQARAHLACRLAQKAYQNNQPLLIVTGSQAQSQRLDELLWTFEDTSFIPHGLGQNCPIKTPIIISENVPENAPQETLMNVSDQPLAFDRKGRILELILANDMSRQQGRLRYKTYQTQNAEMHTHRL